MNDVLLLSFYFPPFTGIEVVRAVKWTKYLPQAGWRPIVLTTAAEGDLEPRMASDLRGVEVVRTAEPFLPKPGGSGAAGKRRRVLPVWIKRWMQSTVFFPDKYRSWIRAGRATVPQLQALYPEIRVVVATGYPWSSFLLAEQVAAALRVPFVCDLRDAWTLNPSKVWNTTRHRRQEERVLQAASAVILATESMRLEYVSQYPYLARKFHVIRNGYDPEDREEAALLRRMLREGAGDSEPRKLRVVYTGTFNGHDVPPADNQQSPYYFLLALQQLKQNVPDLATRLEVILAGRVPFGELVQEMGLSDIVQMPGHVGVEDTLELQAGADLLLLFVGAANRHVLTGKVFEYMATGNPILAMIPRETELEKLLHRYGPAWVTGTNDVVQIADHLQGLLEEKQVSGTPDWAFVDGFSRAVQTTRLAALLEEVSTGHETARV
ncbi:glycosyltransferase [Tumebacillus flagellatus]|uniref:Glycosyltransferase subfamily 4-like N-terminal domain-containing protein n=1 Tax=Tumebacillus flagellatus TaxID=1157490 RepID=A0A074LIQ7_9BACL|nr:glycosyltransferase [Tumebacillus flagellatus]KEO81019.1 hypothetical protein EL26_23045 [Tumebacillus flagellatus]